MGHVATLLGAIDVDARIKSGHDGWSPGSDPEHTLTLSLTKGEGVNRMLRQAQHEVFGITQFPNVRDGGT